MVWVSCLGTNFMGANGPVDVMVLRGGFCEIFLLVENRKWGHLSMKKSPEKAESAFPVSAVTRGMICKRSMGVHGHDGDERAKRVSLWDVLSCSKNHKK
jgi:hypothetical protein